MKLKGTEVLVIGALRKESHIAHLNLAEALALAERIKPKTTYLTHMSHEIGLHAELAMNLPAGVEPAYDGLVINLE